MSFEMIQTKHLQKGIYLSYKGNAHAYSYAVGYGNIGAINRSLWSSGVDDFIKGKISEHTI